MMHKATSYSTSDPSCWRFQFHAYFGNTYCSMSFRVQNCSLGVFRPFLSL